MPHDPDYDILTVYLLPGEKDAIKEACASAGISVADAVRYGAPLFLQARTATLTRRGRKPHSGQTTKGGE